MFGKNDEAKAVETKVTYLESEVRRLNDVIERNKRENEFEKKQLQQDHNFEVINLSNDQALALKEKDFELETFKDTELLKRNDEINSLKQKVAVLEEKNKMLDRIIDLDADIIDVKDLVSSLIKKLPEINLKDITINTKR